MTKKTTKKTAARKKKTIRIVCPALFGPLAADQLSVLQAGLETQEPPSDDLAQTLAQEKGVPVLVATPAPDVALARLMQQGQAPAQALEGWTQWAQGTMKAQRRSSRRITLMDLALLEGPAEDQEPLVERLKLAPGAFAATGAAGAGAADLELLCARAMIAADPEAAALSRDWHEAAYGPQAPAGGAEIGPRVLERARTDARELTRLREALSLHLENADALETLRAQVASMVPATQAEAAQAALRQKLEAAQTERARQSQADAATIKDLREALFLHLENADRMTQAMRDLQEHADHAQQLEADRLALRAQLEAAAQEIALQKDLRQRAGAVLGARLLWDAAAQRDLYGQLGQVQTASEAQQNAVSDLQARQEATQAELASVRADLEAKQAELETLRASHQAQGDSTRQIEEVLKASKKARDAARAEAKAAKTSVSQLQEQLSQAREKMTALEAEMTRIYGSHSWRITQPMRALRRAATHSRDE
jgi:chemotaxis protein histidine kinase CheA